MMRFMLGLIAGVVMALGTAAFFEQASFTANASSLWTTMRARGQALLDTLAVDAATDGVHAMHPTDASKGVDATHTADASNAADVIADVLKEAVPAPPEESDVHVPAGEPTRQGAETVPPQPVGDASAIAETADANLPASEGAANTEPMEASSGTESVWTPFHSERSANGFAEALERKTGHVFAIDKRGPGKYQVTFDYANENEKATILQQIASLTGDTR